MLSLFWTLRIFELICALLTLGFCTDKDALKDVDERGGNKMFFGVVFGGLFLGIFLLINSIFGFLSLLK